MSKKKTQSKVIPLLSPANYIKTKARSLPLDKCYALENWEEAGMSLVIVSRKHVNGNVTFGGYLIDLLCLGVKDTFFRFNEASEEVEYIIESGNLVEIDYTLAHNIIYGSEAFAGEYGLKPHKDWAVTQYILEPDEEEVPLIEITFGREGKPCYIAGPHDSQLFINNVLSTLNQNAGPGNYHVGTDYDEDMDDDFLFNREELERIASGGEQTSRYRYYGACMEVIHSKNIGLPISTINPDRLAEEEKALGGHGLFIENDELDIVIEEFLNDHEQALDEETPEMLSYIEKLMAENPENPYIFYRAYMHYIRFGPAEQAESIVVLMRERFPDFLFFDFVCAIVACRENRLDDAALLLKGHYLEEAFPERKKFAYAEHLHFCAAWCAWFTASGMLSEAIAYAGQIIEASGEFCFVDSSIDGICRALSVKILDEEA